MELFQKGREIGYEEMKELGVCVRDSAGRKICKVRSAKAVKGGVVVKILAPVDDGTAVLRHCTKCKHEVGAVVEFSGHVNGGYFSNKVEE